MEQLLSLWVISSLVVGAVVGISSIHAEISLNRKKKKPEVRRVPFMTCALMDWTGGRYPASLPIATIMVWYK